MSLVHIALGSNLGDRQGHLLRASRELGQLPGCSAMRMSSIYETEPMGPQDQPDYLNCVCEIMCTLSPAELLTQLQQLERQHGRMKSTTRWTARPLDLDILLFGNLQIKTDTLQIPHAGIAQRSFVLWPLAELQPELCIAGLGSVKTLIKHCPTYGIRQFESVSESR